MVQANLENRLVPQRRVEIDESLNYSAPFDDDRFIRLCIDTPFRLFIHALSVTRFDDEDLVYSWMSSSNGSSSSLIWLLSVQKNNVIVQADIVSSSADELLADSKFVRISIDLGDATRGSVRKGFAFEAYFTEAMLRNITIDCRFLTRKSNRSTRSLFDFVPLLNNSLNHKDDTLTVAGVIIGRNERCPECSYLLFSTLQRSEAFYSFGNSIFTDLVLLWAGLMVTDAGKLNMYLSDSASIRSTREIMSTSDGDSLTAIIYTAKLAIKHPDTIILSEFLLRWPDEIDFDFSNDNRYLRDAADLSSCDNYGNGVGSPEILPNQKSAADSPDAGDQFESSATHVAKPAKRGRGRPRKSPGEKVESHGVSMLGSTWAAIDKDLGEGQTRAQWIEDAARRKLASKLSK